MDATAPWGWSTLFQFKYFDNGRYALVSAPPPLITPGNCADSVRYLNADGILLNSSDASNSSNKNNGTNSLCESLAPNLDCLFTIEYHAGFIAFRDASGKYLAASGRQAVLRTRSQAVGKDELFEFVPAPLQVAFRANFNQKWISTKQGKFSYLASLRGALIYRARCWLILFVVVLICLNEALLVNNIVG